MRNKEYEKLLIHVLDHTDQLSLADHLLKNFSRYIKPEVLLEYVIRNKEFNKRDFLLQYDTFQLAIKHSKVNQFK